MHKIIIGKPLAGLIIIVSVHISDGIYIDVKPSL